MSSSFSSRAGKGVKTLEPSRFLKCQNLTCDVARFARELKDLPTRGVSDAELKLSMAGDSAKPTPEQILAAVSAASAEGVDINLPVRGEECLVWAAGVPLPEPIERIRRQICALFDVGSEITSWEVTYFPPTEATSGVTTIQKAKSPLVSRYVVCLGTQEVLHIESQGASAKRSMKQNDALQIVTGAAGELDLFFDNTSGATPEARKGFRTMTIRKSPHRRHVLVLDGCVSSEHFGTAISQMAAKFARDGVSVEQLAAKFTGKEMSPEVQKAMSGMSSKLGAASSSSPAGSS